MIKSLLILYSKTFTWYNVLQKNLNNNDKRNGRKKSVKNILVGLRKLENCFMWHLVSILKVIRPDWVILAIPQSESSRRVCVVYQTKSTHDTDNAFLKENRQGLSFINNLKGPQNKVETNNIQTKLSLNNCLKMRFFSVSHYYFLVQRA